MQNKLVKAWGPYGIGTVVVDNKEEADATPGSVRVSRARFAKLHDDGHFAPVEPERPIPSEVRTSVTRVDSDATQAVVLDPDLRELATLADANREAARPKFSTKTAATAAPGKEAEEP